MASTHKLEATLSPAASKSVQKQAASSSTKKSAGKKASGGRRSRKSTAVQPHGETAGKASKPVSKRDQLAALLVRDQGATIAQMQQVSGWLPYTVRAALSGLKKLGYAIDSDKLDGVRTYRAVSPQ